MGLCGNNIAPGVHWIIVTASEARRITGRDKKAGGKHR
jgi:hypothetical protein